MVTSRNTKKLRKYQLLDAPEVCFWQDGKINTYSLQDGEYVNIEASLGLPNLDLSHIEECLMMDSQLDSVLAFQERYTPFPPKD